MPSYKSWTLEDDKWLFEKYSTTPIKDLAQKLDRTESAIRQRYCILNNPNTYIHKRMSGTESAIVSAYRCSCSPGVVFDRNSYEAHKKRKSHVVHSLTEEVKDLRIKLEMTTREKTALESECEKKNQFIEMIKEGLAKI